jgi:hypothetical protein
MGFLGLFGKKKNEEDAIITPPLEEPKSEVKTTTSIDENASFEIPDFSEEDLDFDLGVEDFVPEEQSMLDQEETQGGGDHKDFRDYFKFEESPSKIEKETSDETEFDIPSLEEAEELPIFEITEEIPLQVEEIQKVTLDIKPVFLERKPYTRILSLVKKINSDVAEEITIMDQAHKTNDQEIKIHEEIKKELDDIQHNLLYTDQKLFG